MPFLTRRIGVPWANALLPGLGANGGTAWKEDEYRPSNSAAGLGGLALLVAAVLFLGATSQADATTRYAVAGGIGNSLDCTSTGDNCSLRWVLENVVLANDEVVVRPARTTWGRVG